MYAFIWFGSDNKKPGKVYQMFGTYNGYVILNILESTAVIIIEVLTNVPFTGFTVKHLMPD